jgi:preprotein translocase subunit SecA
MRIFGGEKIAGMMERLNVDDSTPIENRIISRSLEGAQKKVEGYHFDQRKSVVQYDDVMNRHRKAIYAMRREILKSENISKRIRIMIEEEAHALAISELAVTDQFEDAIKHVFPFDDPTLDRLFDSPADKFEKVIKTEAGELYKARTAAFTPDIMHKVERDIYLQILDNLWMQHLENMEHLREGIHWMSVGQQDPLVEYRRRGQLLFDGLQSNLRHDVVRSIFHAQPVDEDELNRAIETDLTLAARGSVDNAASILTNQNEFDESDFKDKKAANKAKVKRPANVKQARKKERKRKTAAKRRKK